METQHAYVIVKILQFKKIIDSPNYRNLPLTQREKSWNSFTKGLYNSIIISVIQHFKWS